MLSVTIPWDFTSARVNMDFMEMELTAQVTNIRLYLISPYFVVTRKSKNQLKRTNKKQLKKKYKIKHKNRPHLINTFL